MSSSYFSSKHVLALYKFSLTYMKRTFLTVLAIFPTFPHIWDRKIRCLLSELMCILFEYQRREVWPISSLHTRCDTCFNGYSPVGPLWHAQVSAWWTWKTLIIPFSNFSVNLQFYDTKHNVEFVCILLAGCPSTSPCLPASPVNRPQSNLLSPKQLPNFEGRTQTCGSSTGSHSPKSSSR